MTGETRGPGNPRSTGHGQDPARLGLCGSKGRAGERAEFTDFCKRPMAEWRSIPRGSPGRVRGPTRSSSSTRAKWRIGAEVQCSDLNSGPPTHAPAGPLRKRKLPVFLLHPAASPSRCLHPRHRAPDWRRPHVDGEPVPSVTQGRLPAPKGSAGECRDLPCARNE